MRTGGPLTYQRGDYGVIKTLVTLKISSGPLPSINDLSLKPSGHSTIFVAGNKDLIFCRQRRKRISSMFDIEDRRQRQKSFMFVSRTQQVSVASDKNILPQRQKSCCVRKVLAR